MGDVRVEIDHSGAASVLRSAGVSADLAARAASIAAAASAETPSGGPFDNPAYVVQGGEGSFHGTARAYSSVIAANPASIVDNIKRKTLLKSIDAGR